MDNSFAGFDSLSDDGVINSSLVPIQKTIRPAGVKSVIEEPFVLNFRPHHTEFRKKSVFPMYIIVKGQWIEAGAPGKREFRTPAAWNTVDVEASHKFKDLRPVANL